MLGALLQSVQCLEGVVNSALLLQMVFRSLEKLTGTHDQCALSFRNPAYHALFILLKERRDIESSPNW
jgi:hypothetical protein